MYKEKLEKLIEMALLDGELSEKEKQILFKNAEKEGVDLDEFEMVLDAKLFEKQKSMKPEKKETRAAPKSKNLRDVRKCTACGAIAESFATSCPDCATEFRNIEASKNIVTFFEKLDKIESNREEKVYNNDAKKNNIGLGTILKWLLFWYIMLPLKIIVFIINKSKPVKWSMIDARKEELILNFPIPVSREDILEFSTLAASKINQNTYYDALSEETKYKDAWNKVWLKKADQIHSKANLSMKSDKKSLEEVNNICLSIRSIIKKNSKKKLNIILGFLSLIIIITIWSIISITVSNSKLNEQKEIKKEAEVYIKSGDYKKANTIILTLENESFKVELESEIQLNKNIEKIDALEIFLKKRRYSKLKLELEKINWIKSSENYDTEKIERKRYKVFLKRKAALNHQLPKKYQVEIESEYSL